MPKKSKNENVPKQMQATFEAIVDLTDKFCKESLNEEYALLARQATAALCRKRPSPLEGGRTNTWACGIIYALGFVNFLFDKDNQFYITTTDLCKGFGLSKSTGAAKAKTVRDLLEMFQMSPDWYLPSKMEDNVHAWLISVNGFMVDARHLSREIQELAFEKGLIPYIPSEQ
ncbi:DUF6398 domain-containing protein [Deltaproteobacteria bacterium TL4]